MNVEPPETLVIIESILYKSNGFAIADEEGEKTRIIYFFCPTCQRTNVELKKSKSKRKAVATGKKIIEVQA